MNLRCHTLCPDLVPSIRSIYVADPFSSNNFYFLSLYFRSIYPFILFTLNKINKNSINCRVKNVCAIESCFSTMNWDKLNENVRHCGPRGVINIIRKIDRSKRIISLENFIFIRISSLRLSKEIFIFSCLITMSWLCTFIFCTPNFQISMWWPKLQNNIQKCKMTVAWSILKNKNFNTLDLSQTV